LRREGGGKQQRQTEENSQVQIENSMGSNRVVCGSSAFSTEGPIKKITLLNFNEAMHFLLIP
jgi:hypothetical protein